MKPRIKLGEAKTSSGSKLELIQHDQDFLLMSDGEVLMSTRLRHSEEVLARFALEGMKKDIRILIGGLGMGFTLRAALDVLGESGAVIQVELIPEVIAWNRGPMGASSGYPVEDPRTKVIVGDVGDVMRNSSAPFDAILLDVDNGPSAMVSPNNKNLYSERGLRIALAALKPQGRLAIWSANEDHRFEKRLKACGFHVTVHRAKGSRSGGSAKHVIFLGTKLK